MQTIPSPKPAAVRRTRIGSPGWSRGLLRSLVGIALVVAALHACKKNPSEAPEPVLISSNASLLFQSSAACPALVALDEDQCDSADCRGVVSGNALRCGTGDCTAIVRRKPDQCTNPDCEAMAAAAQGEPDAPLTGFVGSAQDCESAACRAVIRGNAAACPQP